MSLPIIVELFLHVYSSFIPLSNLQQSCFSRAPFPGTHVFHYFFFVTITTMLIEVISGFNFAKVQLKYFARKF
jgi:hypothetical protein